MTERITHDLDTGEILEAADGNPMPRAAATLADTIRLLDDGQFDADISGDMRELVRKMEAHAHNAKGVAKGKIVLTLAIELRNGAHVITPSYKIAAPTPAPVGTLLFAFDDGRLSRNRPGQGAFFGVKAVEPEDQAVRSISAPETTTRTVG